jgi:hypothetical protein
MSAGKTMRNVSNSVRSVLLGCVVVVLGLAALGCAPTLHVRHLDWSIPDAIVWVDGKEMGVVRYGETFSIDVREGQHHIKTTRPGETTNPWHKTGATWVVVALEDVVLTLLPKPASAGSE